MASLSLEHNSQINRNGVLTLSLVLSTRSAEYTCNTLIFSFNMSFQCHTSAVLMPTASINVHIFTYCLVSDFFFIYLLACLVYSSNCLYFIYLFILSSIYLFVYLSIYSFYILSLIFISKCELLIFLTQ